MLTQNKYREFKLYVRNLPWSATEVSLRNIFKEHGDVTFVRICTDPDTKKSRGFGFVSFNDKAGASKALEKLNNYEIDGRNIEIRDAHFRETKKSREHDEEHNNSSLFAEPMPVSKNKKKVCISFARSGICEYGSDCKFAHSEPNSNLDVNDVSKNKVEEGTSQDNKGRIKNQKPCISFLQSGECKFGVDCKFAHLASARGSSNNRADPSDPRIDNENLIESNQLEKGKSLQMPETGKKTKDKKAKKDKKDKKDKKAKKDKRKSRDCDKTEHENLANSSAAYVDKNISGKLDVEMSDDSRKKIRKHKKRARDHNGELEKKLKKEPKTEKRKKTITKD